MTSTPWRGFASDNYAGIHPEVLEAIARVNEGHQVAYGDDDTTAELTEAMKAHFGPAAEVFPVFNGTGANVVALQAMTKRWEAVVCAASAHVNVDEGGAPEKGAGLKLWTVPTDDGKLTPDLIDTQAWGFGDVHRAQPGVVTITQSTELGTLYSVDEIARHHRPRPSARHARAPRRRSHRQRRGIARGLPSASSPPTSASTWSRSAAPRTARCSVRRSSSSTPTPRPASPTCASRRCSSPARCASCPRQLLALLTDDLWLRNAQHSNAMARELHSRVRGIEGVTVVRPVQANAVFAILPAAVTERLQERFRFYTWDQVTGEVRWMCSWDTTLDDVVAFADAVAEEMAATR